PDRGKRNVSARSLDTETEMSKTAISKQISSNKQAKQCLHKWPGAFPRARAERGSRTGHCRDFHSVGAGDGQRDGAQSVLVHETMENVGDLLELAAGLSAPDRAGSGSVPISACK